jgi:hypothetical protein
MSLHRLAEARSLAYYRAVAAKILRNPSLLDQVRDRLDEWIREGGRSAAYAREWPRLVDLPVPELASFLGEESERATSMRQATPFAGLLEPRERWRIWSAVRDSFGRKDAHPGETHDAESP